MRHSLIDKLCCPFDKHLLELHVFSELQGDVQEGLLYCPECGRYYPIVQGIPIMTPDTYRDLALELPILNRWAALGWLPAHLQHLAEERLPLLGQR